MTEDHLIYDVDQSVATITFNRPDKLNALTPAMLTDFFKLVGDASADDAVRVIVLTGKGRGFSAGLDLSVIGSGQSDEVVTDPGIGPQWDDEIGPALKRFYSVGWNGLITSRKPTIAAINPPLQP